MECSEDDVFVPISALQHYVYCPRQAALIHVERLWRDDVATAQGHILHERADRPGTDHRRGVRVERHVWLRSTRLHVEGIADVIEWLADESGQVVPTPVEYKRGKVRRERANEVQVCAQAMCIEEAHGCALQRAFIFYAGTGKRVAVELNDELRAATAEVAEAVRELIETGVLPAPSPGPKCRGCSLAEQCLPYVSGDLDQSRRYLSSLLD